MTINRTKPDVTGRSLAEQFSEWSPALKALALAFMLVLAAFGIGILALCAFVTWSVVSAMINPVAGAVAAAVAVTGLCVLAAYTALSK